MASRFGAMNFLVVPLLRSRLRSLVGGRLAILTVTGRITGKKHSFPVMCAADDQGMVVIAAFADAKSWWKNLRTEAEITVELEGRVIRARASALLAEDAIRGHAIRRYLRRFGSVAKTLGVATGFESRDDSALGREAKGSVVVRIVPIPEF